VTYKPDPGTTLAAIEAMRTQDTFTRDQVAYLIAVAYQVGRRHTLAEDLAETVACWDEHATPAQTRERRIAARIAAYERTSGPATYLGGPVDWETGQPVRHLGVAA
jgi:hypothetical protein